MALPTWTLAWIAAGLRSAGYRVRYATYRTRDGDAAALVERYLVPAVEACGRDTPVHLVTHSLGGLLVRLYLQQAALPAGSRVVMLAPPNQGSAVADRVRGWWVYRLLTGVVGQQLGTGPDALVRALHPVSAEIGVIAARQSLHPWFSRWMAGPGDGVVSLSSARLAEMRDFVVVTSTHTLMLFSPLVRRQVLRFLAEGRFGHPDPAA